VTFLRHLCHRLNVPRGRMTCHDCWRHFGTGLLGGGMDFLVSTTIWNFVMGGLDTTPTQVRLGLYEQRWRPRAEGVGGVVCLSCFDKRARALNIEYRDHLVLFGHDSWMGGFYEGGVPL
jgi:hypothetical protein